MRDIAKLLAALIVLLVLIFVVLRPLVRGLLAPPRIEYMPSPNPAHCRLRGAGCVGNVASAAARLTTRRSRRRAGSSNQDPQARRAGREDMGRQR